MLYLMFKTFPFTESVVMCHQAKSNDMFLPGSRVGPSPLTKIYKVKICLLQTLTLQIGFK
jgi:hypothetical protein